jgi:hypothetical protein
MRRLILNLFPLFFALVCHAQWDANPNTPLTQPNGTNVYPLASSLNGVEVIGIGTNSGTSGKFYRLSPTLFNTSNTNALNASQQATLGAALTNAVGDSNIVVTVTGQTLHLGGLPGGGNGYGTNISGEQITSGTVSAARLPTNVVRSVSSQFTGVASGSASIDGTGNLALQINASSVQNQFSFDKGGQPFILDGQAIDNKSLAGQPWAAMQLPWVGCYSTTWYYAGQNATNIEGEAWITNAVEQLKISGVHYTLTNKCIPAWYLDGCWSYGRVSLSDWGYIVTNWGTIKGNTNAFPHGIPWIVDYLHTNGFKVMCQLYCCTNITPAAADTMLISIYGGSTTVPYTNGVGNYPTNVSTDLSPYVTESTPDSARMDVSQLAHWGFDGIVLADGANLDPQQFSQIDCAYGNISLEVQIPWGWNGSIPGGKFYPVPTNNNLTYVNTFRRYEAIYAIGHPTMTMVYQSPNGDQDYCGGYRTKYAHSAFFYDNTGQGTGATAMRRILRDFPTTRKANEGSYVSWYALSDPPSLVTMALTHGLLINGASPYQSVSGSAFSTFTNALANTNFLNVLYDREQNFPITLYDNGTNQNGNAGGCWASKLSDGSWAVGVFNQDVSRNMTFTWSQLGIDPNTWCDVYAAIDSWGSNGDKGVYTNSFTASVWGGAASLYIVKPKHPTYQAVRSVTVGSGLSATYTANPDGSTNVSLASTVIVPPANNAIVFDNFSIGANGSPMDGYFNPGPEQGAGDWFMYGYALTGSGSSFYPASKECYGKVLGTNLVSEWQVFSTNGGSGNILPRINLMMAGTNWNARFVGIATSNSYTLPPGTNLTILRFTNALNFYSSGVGSGGYWGGNIPTSVPYTNAASFHLFYMDGTWTNTIWLMRAKFWFQ